MAEPAKSWWRSAVDLLLETFDNFNADGVPRLAAAMSYFLLLAVAPVLLIVNAVVGFVGRHIAFKAPPEHLAEATAAAASPFAQISEWAGSYAPYVIALFVILGAMGVFGMFIEALGIIWKTPPRRTPIRAFLRDNLLSFALLGVAALALLVAVVVGGAISAFGARALTYLTDMGVSVPGVALVWLVRAVLVFVTASVLFEVAFTVVPDRKMHWRDVFSGALITAVLFMVGELWLGYYLSTTQQFSIFGTFEFFVALIVWIFYSALVALWGAELTRLLVLRAEARRGVEDEKPTAGPRAEPPAAA